MKNIASVLLWVVVLALFSGPEKAFGLEIYRLGGEALPRPPETRRPDWGQAQKIKWSKLSRDAADFEATGIFRVHRDGEKLILFKSQVSIPL